MAARQVETLNQVARAVSDRELCPNGLAYTWPATQVLLAEVALVPVCLMVVNRDEALSVTHHGARYSFCSADCRDRFVGDPEAWVARAAPASGE